MFDIYKDGAWQEPENVERVENGARTDSEASCRYKDGAWREVWSNLKIMTKKSDNIAAGILQIGSEGLAFEFTKFATEWQGGMVGTLGGGGTIVFYLDGLWVNPAINLSWEGGLIYQASGMTYYNRVSAGDISVYTRTTSGQESTQKVVSTVGSTLNGETAGTVSTESGSYEGTISGTFDRVGLSINIAGYGGTMVGNSTLNIWELLIDGRKIGFPADAAFNRQDWG